MTRLCRAEYREDLLARRTCLRLNLECLLLALAAVLGGDAVALGAHALDHTYAILSGSQKAVDLQIHDLDAEVIAHHLVNGAAHMF